MKREFSEVRETNAIYRKVNTALRLPRTIIFIITNVIILLSLSQ